jgi:hypothetical protein
MRKYALEKVTGKILFHKINTLNFKTGLANIYIYLYDLLLCRRYSVSVYIEIMDG